MKLAEALILRADLQTRLQELSSRLMMNARVQEGERPAENPDELLKQVEEVSAQLENLITRINLTNATTTVQGDSITALLARRECMTQRISILRSFLDNASSTVMRGGRMEVKVYSTVPVAQLRKQTDRLSEQLRKLDTAIQSVNWTTELH